MKRTLVGSLMLLLTLPVLSAGVTVNATRQPAEKVFARIMRQTGKNFIYSGQLLRDMTVTVKAADLPLEEVLDMMFDGTGVAYRISGNNVILTPRESASKTATAATRSVTVSGIVREAGSGEPLIGAIVISSAQQSPVTTNQGGFYSLQVPAGKSSVKVCYPGYEPFSSGPLDLSANTVVNVDLGNLHQLDEVTVTETINRVNDLHSPHVGSFNLSGKAISSTPVIFGESDVIKTLQLQPGISAGIEGLAGMYVHGGNADENLYTLDNIPLYQVNHLGGIFSAFNTEAIKSVDFYKSSFPARLDGRLSSFMDVHTKDGSLEGHHGSFRLGLTSGAFNIDGPIDKSTTYSVALRRSWLEVITVPMLALINATQSEDDYNFRYAFSDLNAKVTHRFSDRSNAHVMFYYSDDILRSTSKWRTSGDRPWEDIDKYRLHWGNIVASAGWNYMISPEMFAEFTGAFSRYYSTMTHDYNYLTVLYGQDSSYRTRDRLDSDNNITDWILRADFNWHPSRNHRVDFGANYTRHSFLPSRSKRQIVTDEEVFTVNDGLGSVKANELNAYISDDWTAGRHLRVNAGLHASLFAINGKSHYGFSPRAAICYNPSAQWSVKASYSRATQYVHQLTQSYLSLPTDQWVPVTGCFKPQTSDQIAVGACRLFGGAWSASAELYYKWMHNLVDYRDEYYLASPGAGWEAELTTGKGTAKGLDLKFARETGKLTGHIAYSLLYADRTFPERNGGRTYPARFDNRHKINILLNWKINDRWEMAASWIGMSGNLITLPTQQWISPDLSWSRPSVARVTDINNYRLPFYHRLDLSFTRHTRRGFWNFSLYNAYCHMNVIGVRLGERYDRPVFQKIHFLPIIPSVSYTWQF